MTNIKPLGTRVLLEPIEEIKHISGGIYLPDNIKTTVQQYKVIDIGPDIDKTIINTNNIVLINKNDGVDIKIDNKNYIIITEENILAVLN